MIKPWPLIASRKVGDFRIFQLRVDEKTSPRTRLPHDFYILECVNWVNVLAVTPESQLVMVEQFRHGTNTVELEIPGGIMDATDASPVATAIRELREETGYEGEQARLLGQVASNPAIMNNTCFTILIENCHPRHELQWDGGEDMLTRLVPLGDISGLVAQGRIRHSLVVVALHYFDLWQRGLMPPPP